MSLLLQNAYRGSHLLMISAHLEEMYSSFNTVTDFQEAIWK